jgi:hypothetical protein
VPSDDVEEVLSGLWLLTAKLVHQGSASHARPECQYNVGNLYLWEFVAFLGEMPVVIPQGLPLFLSTTHQILGVARPHVHALEIPSKDLLEIPLAIDGVSRQVIQPGSGCVSQVDGEELNDKQIAIRPACPAREAVVL